MPRPRKQKRLGRKPKYNEFGPKRIPNHEKTIITLEEYETIKLIDNQNMNQQECAAKMNIGRTTIQNIYSKARKKIADAIINGKTLIIEDADYSK